MPDNLLIDTPRCRIRPAAVNDLAALERSVGDPAFPQDLPLARMFKDGKLSQWLKRMCSYSLEPKLWSITTLASPVCIGQIALMPESAPGRYWLSYWLAPEYWGRGMVKECITTLLQHGAPAPTCEVVVAAVAESNHRSISVLLGLGFAQTAAKPTESPIPEGHVCFARGFTVGDAA